LRTLTLRTLPLRIENNSITPTIRLEEQAKKPQHDKSTTTTT